MMERPDTSSDWLEIAMLPPRDPRRIEFERGLSALSETQRQEWLAVQQESDSMRDGLNIAPPRDLIDRLLKIPDQQPASYRWTGRRIGLIAAMAAMIAIAIGVAMYIHSSEEQPQYPDTLNSTLAQNVAGIAVQLHEHAPALVSADTDPATLEKTLATQPLPFSPQVLKPKDASFAIQGAGTCDFGGAKAVFTRYEEKGNHYTVYQIDGKAIGIPGSFRTTNAAPGSGERVVIWPGKEGKCAWALVMEGSTARDVFSAGYYTQPG